MDFSELRRSATDIMFRAQPTFSEVYHREIAVITTDPIEKVTDFAADEIPFRFELAQIEPDDTERIAITRDAIDRFVKTGLVEKVQDLVRGEAVPDIEERFKFLQMAHAYNVELSESESWSAYTVAQRQQDQFNTIRDTYLSEMGLMPQESGEVTLEPNECVYLASD